MNTEQDDPKMWPVWLIMLITVAALIGFSFALWFLLQRGSMNERNFAVLAFLVSGPLTLMGGLVALRRNRLIESAPASTIRSAAVGLVALNGQARPRKKLVAPASNVECCWWHCEVDELQWTISKVPSRHWVTIKRISSPELFYVEDATAKVLVAPEEASVEVGERSFPIDGPDASRLSTCLTDWGIVAMGWPGGLGPIRIREKAIQEHQPLYVVGKLTPSVDCMALQGQCMVDRRRVVKNDPAMAAQADRDKDSRTDSREGEEVCLRQEEEFPKEEVVQENEIPACDGMVLRALAGGEPSLISDRSAKEVVRSLGQGAIYAIIGSIGLCVASIWTALVADWSPIVIFGIVGGAYVLSFPLLRMIDERWRV